jgi:tetratricopeptide (TPR) repeat protein
MAKNKNKQIKIKPKAQQALPENKKTNIDWMILVIVALCFIIYGNTIPNHYSMDDDLVVNNNKVVAAGIKSIPEIWTSLYSEGKLKYEYRPVVKTTFAIECQFFGQNPHVSHLFNILIYTLLCLILFNVLKKLFKNFSPIFSFVITLIFLAHPVHTEVVTSIKNRDEMLSLLFCLISLNYLFKYIDTNKFKYVFIAMFVFLFAYWSKASALVWLVLFPLTLYFYSGVKIKKLFMIFGLILIAVVIARFLPTLYLPKPSREVFYFENPLFFQKDILTKLGTGMMSLLFYIRILVFPHPLLCYYGYNEIPIVKLNDIVAILSMIFHICIFIYAIYKIREKHILSFAILFYLISISMFSNIVKPAMGIVAERYLFSASIGFSIVVAYFIFKLLKINPLLHIIPKSSVVKVFLALMILLIPYSAKTITRNKDWDSYISLYKHDIKYLDNSAKANILLAAQMNMELVKYLVKGIVPDNMNATTDSIIGYYKRSLEICPDLYSSYNNIGTEYFTVLKDYEKAIPYFIKALEMHPDYLEATYNLAYSYELLGKYKEAVKYYNKSIALKPDYIQAYNNLANICYFKMRNLDTAILLNKQMMKISPDISQPYINIGNYYRNKKDSLTAIKYYETAIEKTPPNYNLLVYLSNCYKKSDKAKSEKYLQLALDAKNKNSEKMNKND